jgi:hypothetical protein
MRFLRFLWANTADALAFLWRWSEPLHPLALRFLSPAVRRALAGTHLDSLVKIILQAGQFANLDNEQRRQYAIAQVTAYLKGEGIETNFREVVLLVELVYHWVKKHWGDHLTPPPVNLSRR